MNAPFTNVPEVSSEPALVIGDDQISIQSAAPALSPSILDGLAQFVDAAAMLCIGWLAILAEVSHATNEWRFGVLIVALGTILGSRLLKAIGAYEFEAFEHWPTGVARSTIGTCLTLGALCGVLWLTGSPLLSARVWLEPWLLGSLASMALTRLFYLAMISRWRKQGALARRVAIVGTGWIAERLIEALSTDPQVVVAGVYGDHPVPGGTICGGLEVRGSLDELIEDCRLGGTNNICVAISLSESKRVRTVLDRLSVVPADIRLCPDALGLSLGEIEASHLAGVTLLNIRDLPLAGWRYIAKEIEDRLIAAFVLLVSAPLFALIALAIRLDSPGPVFFRQIRHGYNNQLIRVLKFRTLYHHTADANAEKLADDRDPRVTRVGRFLRHTMLDELPQFLNVLRGEMSVVGPRPHAMAAKAGGLLYREAVPAYDARHRMKPGVTGWAQVNGWRGDTKTVEQIQQRVAHDLHYIEHWSVAMDLKIVVMTMLMALRAISLTVRSARRHALPVADAGRSRPSA